MARTCKRGLDYYPFDVDFFQDIKVRKLIKYRGGQAVVVYTLLLCFVYKDGYYIRWDDDIPFIISEQSGLAEEYVEQVINTCVEIGLFHADLFHNEHILTSKGIQERYKEVCEMSRRKHVIQEFNLIQEDSCSNNVDKCSMNAHKCSMNDDKCSINAHKCTTPENQPSKKTEIDTFEAENSTDDATDSCSIYPNKCNINDDKCSIYSDNCAKKAINSAFGTQSKVKERKEKEKRKKSTDVDTKSSTPPSSSSSTLCGEELKVKLDSDVKTLKGDVPWRECVCMTERLNDRELSAWIDRFSAHCLSSGKAHVSVADSKSHFTQWLAIQLAKQRNDGYANITAHSNERRRRVDQVGASADDYKTSF